MTLENVSPPPSCKVTTPVCLAEAMVQALGDGSKRSWLDPCVGSGVFVTAMAKYGVDRDRMTALDIDCQPASSDELAKTQRGVDFLQWAVNERSRFDRVIGNPPYVSISRLNEGLRATARYIQSPSGNRVSLAANYWYAFLCASLKLLKKGGSLAFVLPASWDYADYAKPLRDSLPQLFRRFEVHRSRRPLFDTVQEGSVVIVAIGYRDRFCGLKRYEYDDRDALLAGLRDKSHAPVLPSKATKRGFDANHICRLGDVLDITLGGVTGDARYFLLSDEQRRAHKLPISCMRPVVSKSRHLVDFRLDKATWKQLKDTGERIWLFRPPPRLLEHPAVREYLALPADEGGCNRTRYKVKARNPWYLTPLPYTPDGFMSGMSLPGPWICVNALPRLTASNTLYTIRFCKRLAQNEMCGWALSLLASDARKELDNKCRVYADGLPKYEPGDIANVSVVKPRTFKGAKCAYRLAIQALLRGKITLASQIADQWLAQ